MWILIDRAHPIVPKHTREDPLDHLPVGEHDPERLWRRTGRRTARCRSPGCRARRRTGRHRGRRLDAVRAADLALGTALLVSAAGSILGRDDTQSGRLLHGLGIGAEDIRLGQDSGSLLGTMPQSTVAGKTNTTNTQDVLSVGKRLSDDIYLSYQQGLADAEGSMRVAWQVTKAFQVILRAGYQPGVDAVYRFTLDDAPIKIRP